MSLPLFNFELLPLERIQPWGEPDDPNLHWYGLTYGVYWIQAGDTILFEYSSEAQAQFGAQRFCDYPVARLYEDLIELAPNALEPVPRAFHSYIAHEKFRQWDQYLKKWIDAFVQSDASDEDMTLIENASSWFYRRSLDSAYLIPSTYIVIWSTQDLVHIEWDNRAKFLEGALAWTAEAGSWQISRKDFMEEVRSFHSRFMEQMAERVSMVEAGALPARINVHLESLRREQEFRSQPIERNLGPPIPATDWQAVSEAVRALEAR